MNELLDALGRIAQLADDSTADEVAEFKYRTMLAPEGVETSDHRFIEEGALVWRTGQPIHVMWSDSETDAHGDASLVGTFVDVHKETIDNIVWVVADDIDWDLHEDNDTSARAKRLVDEGRLAGVSVHMSEMGRRRRLSRRRRRTVQADRAQRRDRISHNRRDPSVRRIHYRTCCCCRYRPVRAAT